MDRIDELEHQSVYIIREAKYHFKKLALLWSMGKDSTVLLWLCRKAFLGRIPFQVLHIDTGRKFDILLWHKPNYLRYVQRENIPVVGLYFARNGRRYRSIGCATCCSPIRSNASTVEQILTELETSATSERAGRAQDKEVPHAMQKLRALGYM